MNNFIKPESFYQFLFSNEFPLTALDIYSRFFNLSAYLIKIRHRNHRCQRKFLVDVVIFLF